MEPVRFALMRTLFNILRARHIACSSEPFNLSAYFYPRRPLDHGSAGRNTRYQGLMIKPQPKRWNQPTKPDPESTMTLAPAVNGLDEVAPNATLDRGSSFLMIMQAGPPGELQESPARRAIDREFVAPHCDAANAPDQPIRLSPNSSVAQSGPADRSGEGVG
jgi:hypothetical protein